MNIPRFILQFAFLVAVAIVAVVVLVAVAGCGVVPSPAAKASTVNAQAHEAVVKVEQHAAAADAAVVSASGKVEAAATQPGLPAAAAEHLSGARADLATAHTELAAVPAQTKVIAAKADEAKVLTAEAQAGQVKAEKALEAEKDHWLGHKTRVLLAWIVGLWAVLGVVAVALWVFNPLGIGQTVGAFIVHILPFGNPISWLQDFWAARRAAATTTTSATAGK